jgi:hypothetical protein
MRRRLRFEGLREMAEFFWGLEWLGGFGWWSWVGNGGMNGKVVRVIPIQQAFYIIIILLY